MSTDIYKLLEEVYDYGYNEGDGFKQKTMLSDFLYQKQQAITALIQEAEAKAFKRGARKGADIAIEHFKKLKTTKAVSKEWFLEISRG